LTITLDFTPDDELTAEEAANVIREEVLGTQTLSAQQFAELYGLSNISVANGDAPEQLDIALAALKSITEALDNYWADVYVAHRMHDLAHRALEAIASTKGASS
jgi:hypothetical protein